MVNINQILNTASYSDNPLSLLTEFLKKQEHLQDTRLKEGLRFVGYVLDLGYDKAKIITSDPYKLAVGGIPRGSFLILSVNQNDNLNLPPHFTLLRVSSVSATPLTNQVQQTYFELHKKSMPELDIWTQGELQWGALECDVLGMFYPQQDNNIELAFSGDVNNVVSAHNYKVYSPDEKLLELIVNGIVNKKDQHVIGSLRPTECQLGIDQKKYPDVKISLSDFKGRRTGMFGKTRLGKSNVVKVLAESIIKTTAQDKSVGQLIFDINGEYANDNPQDGNKSIASAYPETTEVYALSPRESTPSKELKLNFAEQPHTTIQILKTFLDRDGEDAHYVKDFKNTSLPSIDEIRSAAVNEQNRMIRKIQMFWAILKRANFELDESKLLELGLNTRIVKGFNPGFSQDLRRAIYKDNEPATIKSLDDLVKELRLVWEFKNDKNNSNSKLLETSSGKPLFDAVDEALLGFLHPISGSGPKILANYRIYHSPRAGDFVQEIIKLLNDGKTVILDLGNANETIRHYFSDLLSTAIFKEQERKFVSNQLGEHFIQLYFEEAHNLFPPTSNDNTTVYHRFAKEGAKFHIGMVYSTQSPSTISKELLVQTENFFVGHLSSSDEANALSKLQSTFKGLEEDIKKCRTPGYMRILTTSHRFIIPVQVKKFEL
ncbi:ATP-binding protein [Lysinibacillus fusiformis]|uniref:ATP-binding protein n=1 Tax=Lysinibacillus fusiformis TaxID=28031 RepID=UPI0018E6278B|nr:DUF87 domain-containing protein [Lysinibacillus fusiformis]MBI6862767.1 DUF87 domain-containing protein [Lysinibacillus fusiformis]